jgi:hypothetical protein
MIKQVLLALCLACAAPAMAFGQEAQSPAEPSILDKAINSPAVDSWSIYGERQRNSIIRSPGVVGERAVRVRVGRGENAWSVGANAAITGPINAGDVLLLAFWARTEELPEGQQTGVISSAGVQLSASPYTAVFHAPAHPTNEWKMYYASGVADRAFAPGEAGVALHLAAARQVIELGPVFVLNFGPNHDVSKLPRNE